MRKRSMAMCVTNAYLKTDDTDEMYMESLARIEVDGNILRLTDIFGDKQELNGRIIEVNFQGGKVILERL